MHKTLIKYEWQNVCWDADKNVVHILFLPQAAESNSKKDYIFSLSQEEYSSILFRQGFIIFLHDFNDVK